MSMIRRLVASTAQTVLEMSQGIISNDAAKTFVEKLKLPEWTPDIVNLGKFESQYVFCYAPGFLSNIPTDHYIDRGVAYTDEDNFILWKKNLGDLSYPIPLNYEESVWENSIFRKMKDQKSKAGLLYPPGRIGGHLYLLKYPDHWFKLLDERTCNGVMFTRERIKVLVPYHKYGSEATRSGANHTGWVPDTAYVNAWMYLGELDFWKEQIEKSEGSLRVPLVSPINVFHARNKTVGDYYYFSELEYNCAATIDWSPSTWTYGEASTPEKRRKRLANLNKDLKPYVPSNGSKASMP